MPLQFVKSQKERDHLVHKGYRYYLRLNGTDQNTWYCVRLRQDACHAKVFTANNEVIGTKKEHNHTPDSAKIEVKKIIHKMKIAARTTSDHPQVIVASCINGISKSASVQLPAVRSLKRNIRKVRNKADNSHPIPASLSDLIIPEIYQRTSNGDNFLLFDSGMTNDRILIFGTMKNVQHMQSSQEWFADGTFKVAPYLFDQLYTIHISRFNKVFPAVYVLLTNRTESTYIKMLSALKDLAPNLNPCSITTDFEKAAKNAFKAVFPNTTQNGCLFHFGQCFWRQIQKLPEVSRNYVEDPDYALRVKCLTALAFVPPHFVKEAFQTLISDDFFTSSSDIERLVDYVEDTWIGVSRRGKARPPRFAIEEWNVFQRVIDDRARTNNAVEGWHRAFQSQLGASHPTLWKFIDIAMEQQSLNEVQVEQHLGGQSPQPKKPKYRDASERLKGIAEDFEKRDIIEYLEGIAHNLSLNV